MSKSQLRTVDWGRSFFKGELRVCTGGGCLRQNVGRCQLWTVVFELVSVQTDQHVLAVFSTVNLQFPGLVCSCYSLCASSQNCGSLGHGHRVWSSCG